MGKANKKVRWIEKLERVYYKPKQPGSYSGVEGLKKSLDTKEIR